MNEILVKFSKNSVVGHINIEHEWNDIQHKKYTNAKLYANDTMEHQCNDAQCWKKSKKMTFCD